MNKFKSERRLFKDAGDKALPLAVAEDEIDVLMVQVWIRHLARRNPACESGYLWRCCLVMSTARKIVHHHEC